MKKLKNLIISGTLIASLVMTAISPATVLASGVSVKRLSGDDRYKTANMIAEDGWTTSGIAILASGENYPDALSASALAKFLNVPIFLTKKGEVPKETMDTMKDMFVRTAIIVGGPAVISPDVEKQLRSNQIMFARYAGDNRYETSVKIAEQIFFAEEVIVTTGNDYADALSAGSIAGIKKIPVLLVPKDYLPQATKDFLKEKGIKKAYVVGGTDIISDGVAKQLPNVERITGKDKYERNANLIKRFASNLDETGVCVTTGENFPDALAGTVYAATKSQPIVLLPKTTHSSISSLLSERVGKLTNVTIFGGDVAVPLSTVATYIPAVSSSGGSTSGGGSTGGSSGGYNDGILRYTADPAVYIDGKRLNFGANKPFFQWRNFYYPLIPVLDALGISHTKTNNGLVHGSLFGETFDTSKLAGAYFEERNGELYVTGGYFRYHVIGNSEQTKNRITYIDENLGVVYSFPTTDSKLNDYMKMLQAYSHLDPKLALDYFGSGFTPEEEVKAREVLNSIIVGLSTDRQKLEAIHFWVAENIHYQHSGKPVQNPKGKSIAYFTLESRVGQCAEYAYLTTAFLRLAGIPSRVVLSDTSNVQHAWTEAYVDGTWLMVDSTLASWSEFRDGQYIKKRQPNIKLIDLNTATGLNYRTEHYIYDITLVR